VVVLILIVEDDEAIAYLNKRALELAGHHVVVAVDAADARHCLDELVFDAVISDYNLSDVDNGAELLLEVRHRIPHARRVLYSKALPYRMKLAAQAVAHSVVENATPEELVSTLQ
jgi:DNA-binding NtrC family response regulator